MHVIKISQTNMQKSRVAMALIEGSSKGLL
jgi:hypothetical protein